MKLCCSSLSHQRMLQSGALTQLEWVDLCANELMLDGVEFVASHFPRSDDDYLAQLKKLCVDRCLTIASLYHDIPLTSVDVDAAVDHIMRSLSFAESLGSPLLRFRCAGFENSPGSAWRERIRALKSASVQAKFRNVTLALEPIAGSLVVMPEDARRAIKECDSAWLRLALSARELASGMHAAWIEPLGNAVFAIAPMSRLDTFGADEAIDYLSVLTLLSQQHYRGFLSLEYTGDEDEAQAVPRAVQWLRSILAKETLSAAPSA